jgi:ABC-type multidrug transport system fused ATPase/permease subunit
MMLLLSMRRSRLRRRKYPRHRNQAPCPLPAAKTRVFLRDPGVVVLDEASSRLDPATERRLERAVDRLLGRGGAEWGDQPSARTPTAIVIAHRLGTVQRADDILILADGHIEEWGARQALADDPTSRFAGLLQTGLTEVLE